MMSEVLVTVIVVCRNEEKYIKDCIISILDQFEASDSWELLIVDGESSDDTVNIVNSVLNKGKGNFKIYVNQQKTLASGWNIGIVNSIGKYIIRPDAHAVLKPGYIKGAMQTLNDIHDASVVGGSLETQAKTEVGKVIKQALSMKTGVGNSSFRTGESSGFKDTAVYGLYRREVFEKVGLFNEKLIRHQDTEFHSRMISNGLKIYMNHEIGAVYYCRDSILALMNQMFDIGLYFSFLLEQKAGGSLRLRHWIPMLFYLFLCITLIIGLVFKPILYIFYTFALVYLSAILLECLSRSWINKQIIPLVAFFIVPLMHASYAAGTFTGIIRWLIKR